MKTTTTRIVALAGAVAISFGAAACGRSAPTPTTPSTTATTPGASSSASQGTSESDPSSSTSVGGGSETTTTDSGSSSPAEQILQKAKANALAATSVEFSGSVTTGGSTVKIASKGTSDAKTADISIESPEGKAHIINVGGATYVQGDAAFWKSTGAPASVQKAGEKFIKAPSGNNASMTDNLSFTSLAEKAFAGLSTNGLDTDLSEENVSGVACWVIVDKGGKENGALYVSKDTNQIMRFTGTKTSPGQLDFGKWNEDIKVTAPTADQIMAIN